MRACKQKKYQPINLKDKNYCLFAMSINQSNILNQPAIL